MTKKTRILVVAASLALLLVYVFPMWRIDLEAPQYPEGLGMQIWVNTIVGNDSNDLQNINGLNHYIGMRPIEPDSIAELRYMPWIVAFLSLTGLLVAALGRRKVLYVWTGLFVVVALAGLADFWWWEYDYGHNLDVERAIIKIPGQSYQPPLIGSRQILNFRAHSWPGIGGWGAIAAGALAVTATVLELLRGRRGGGETARLAGPPAPPAGTAEPPVEPSPESVTERPVEASAEEPAEEPTRVGAGSGR